jgi:hypothetical protein
MQFTVVTLKPSSPATLTLVSLDWTRDKDPRVPLGHASLLAALEDAAVAATGLSYPVNDEGFEPDDTLREIRRRIEPHNGAAHTVGLGVYVWNEQYVQYLGQALRRLHPELRIVLGGPQISYSGPGLEERYPFADVFVRGYGEEALVELAAAEAPRPIAGVHWAGTHDLRQPTRVDLQALPSPFTTGLLNLQDQRFVRWETKRGCSFRCSFCQHREAGKRLTRNELAVARLTQEIELFCQSGVKDIAVLDPIFNQGPHFMAVLQEFVRRRFDGRLSLQCRFELVEEGFLDLAAQLDCRLEFGLQTIHRKEGTAVNRPNHMPKVEKIIDALHQRDINFEVSLIFGLPSQTLASFRESVDYCLRRKVPVVKAFPLMLLRGTELDIERDKWGLVESDDPIPMVVSSDTFSRAEWKKMAQLSEALKATEGHHPRELTALRNAAEHFTPQAHRWTPPDIEEAVSDARAIF